MPWTVKDVDKHKKGLTPAQKKKWVRTANAVLRECLKDGGTDKTCAPKAIRIANSKFSEDRGMKKLEKVPNGALRLVDTGASGACAFADDGEGGKKLRMVAYSGGIISNHWYWDDLAIDISGVKFDRNKFPVLEQHDTQKKVAFSKKPLKEDNKLILDPDSTVFVDTPFSEEFQKLSAQGFPYQASIYAIPTKVERVAEGSKVEVNGFTMKGPATVWRECFYQEASVCVFGWDKKTESRAFSKEEKTELEIEELGLSVDQDVNKESSTQEEEVNSMDLKEFKEKFADVAKEFAAEIRLAVTQEKDKEFDQEREGFNTQLADMSKRLDESDERIAKFEKSETIRTENELRTEADKIWDVALAKSELRESLYPKVRKHVSYTKFVEDNVLDVEKFAEAIADEISDWEGRTKSEGPVLGAGAGGRSELGVDGEQDDKQKLKDKERTTSLLSLAGHKEDK